jgi:hypothetical protein
MFFLIHFHTGGHVRFLTDTKIINLSMTIQKIFQPVKFVFNCFNVFKDKRSTKHTHKTKDRVTRIPLKTGGELRCSGRVSNSCSTSGTRRVNLVTNPMISHEWGKVFFWPLYCVLLRYTDTDCPFDIFKLFFVHSLDSIKLAVSEKGPP